MIWRRVAIHVRILNDDLNNQYYRQEMSRPGPFQLDPVLGDTSWRSPEWNLLTNIFFSLDRRIQRDLQIAAKTAVHKNG
jgi:hypothetical protein